MPVCLALLDLSDRLVISVFGQDFLDAFYRVQEFADGIVVIQGVDDQGDVFAHIAVDIVRFTQQFRGLVDQVGGQDAVEGPFFVGFIELCHAVGEQTKGGTHEDFVGSPVFEELSYLEHAVTGGDHIVYDDHIFATNISSQEFMSNDRVSSVYNSRVVTAFVEHTHVYAKVVCQIDGTAHAAFIRADDHQMFFIQFQIFFFL